MKIVFAALIFIVAVACTQEAVIVPPPPSLSTVVTKIDLPRSFVGFYEGTVSQQWLEQLKLECEAPCNYYKIDSITVTSSAPQVLTASMSALQYVVLKGVTVGTSDVTACAGAICSSQTFTVVAPPVTPPSPPPVTPPPPPSPPPTGPGFISGVTCSNFSRWSAAQSYYNTWRYSQAAARALDADGDGIACESLPGHP